MNPRLSRLLLAVAAFGFVSLGAIPQGHAIQAGCITVNNSNPTRFVDQNEGNKRITWDLYTNWLGGGSGALAIVSATGGSGNWAFSTVLFVQSTQGWTDWKYGTGFRYLPGLGNLVSAAPPAGDYWYFSCAQTDPL